MSRIRAVAILIAAAGLPLSEAAAQQCGTPWSLFIGTVPKVRADYASIYDPSQAKVVMIGGRSTLTGGPIWGTNLWTAAGPGGGGSWALPSANFAPGHYRHGLAFDASRQRTVMFGGYVWNGSTNVLTNQTWEWDGTSWTQQAPTTSPQAMEATLMAYDAARQRIVLVSTNQAGVGDRATWEYEGITWTLTPDLTPPAWASREFSMGYDAARSRMVLIGPIFESIAQNNGTWERDVSAGAWVLRESGTLPRPVYGHGTTYDPARSHLLYLSDSSFYLGRTTAWEWDGGAGSWRVLSTGGPPAMLDRSAVYDEAGGQVLLFGGQVPGGNITDTLWLYRPGISDGPMLTDVGQRLQDVYIHTPPAVLRVSATGTGTISYQWRLNGVQIFDGGVFSGATTPQLSIELIDDVLSGYYDALVTDGCGTTIRPATFLSIRCYPNCDGSTSPPVLNAEDYQCFLNAYAAGTSYANCDGSTIPPILNANDFQCFLNRMAAGCQ